jgi:hypothetical protein
MDGSHVMVLKAYDRDELYINRLLPGSIVAISDNLPNTTIDSIGIIRLLPSATRCLLSIVAASLVVHAQSVTVELHPFEFVCNGSTISSTSTVYGALNVQLTRRRN